MFFILASFYDISYIYFLIKRAIRVVTSSTGAKNVMLHIITIDVILNITCYAFVAKGTSRKIIFFPCCFNPLYKAFHMIFVKGRTRWY